MGVYQGISFLVAHGSLELIDPDTRIDGHRGSFHRFKPAYLKLIVQVQVVGSHWMYLHDWTAYRSQEAP